MEKKYENDALMVCHQSAEGLHRLGIINNARMREFDEMCLAQESEIANATETSIKKGHNRPVPVEVSG